MEVALFVVSKSPNGSNERCQEGDIVAMRRAGVGIGKKERSLFLWVRVIGLDLNDMGALSDGIDGYDKRRYNIPLERLAQVCPMDLRRVRDAADEYQPCLGFDDETGEYLYNQAPLEVRGLVFDKEVGRYL